MKLTKLSAAWLPAWTCRIMPVFGALERERRAVSTAQDGVSHRVNKRTLPTRRRAE